MITSLPSRRLTALLALALSAIAIVVLLALSAQAKAETHNAACASSVRHGARACVQSRHASKSHKGKAHAKGKGKGKGHHAKHVVTPKSAAKKKAAAKAKPKITAATIKTPAVCEDGSVPVRESDGFFSCDDESEPGCENGSTPMLSRNGLSLICGPAPKGSPADRSGLRRRQHRQPRGRRLLLL